MKSFFTFNYSQPSEYHFSLDSVLLAQRVAQWFSEQTEAQQIKIEYVLDLCSGCGIIGIDTIALIKLNSSNKVNGLYSMPKFIDFLEVQEIYQQHFIKNIQFVEKDLKSYFFYQLNYKQVRNYPELNEKYDLIICNPPYFETDKGVLSVSDFKNRCRFYIDSDFLTLVKSLIYLLKKDGVAFVLIKDLKLHGINLDRQLAQFKKDLKFEKQLPIRTTDLFKITRC